MPIELTKQAIKYARILYSAITLVETTWNVPDSSVTMTTCTIDEEKPITWLEKLFLHLSEFFFKWENKTQLLSCNADSTQLLSCNADSLTETFEVIHWEQPLLLTIESWIDTVYWLSSGV